MQSNKQAFHDRHEEMTERLYNTPGMLPHRYVLVLTNLCNLDCSFCYQVRDPRKDAMTTEQWLHLVQQFPEYARVTLTGGEPLVFKGFREVFTCVAGRFDCNIISNGLLLSEEKIDFLLSFPRFRVLSISIDNIGNTLRDVKPDRWKHVERMMHYFAKRRDELGSSCLLDSKTVVLDENAEQLLDIHRYCVETLPCDTHAFQLLKGSPTQHADYMFPFEAITKKSRAQTYTKWDVIKQQLEAVRRFNLESRKTAFLHPPAASLVTTTSLPDIDYLNVTDHVPENFLPCKFPWSSVHVNVDGQLFPCMAVSMGNVKDTPLRDIILGEKFEQFRQLLRGHGTVEGCNRCGWLRPRRPAEAAAPAPSPLQEAIRDAE